MQTTISKKLKVVNPTFWNHHRGGWSYVVNAVQDQLHCEDGTLFVSCVEEAMMNEEVMSEPWVGFVHQVPQTTLKWFPDLKRLVKNEHFIQSLEFCKGLFTLSTTVKDFLKSHMPQMGTILPPPVVKILYPITPGGIPFDRESFLQSSHKRVLFIGEYQRNFQMFFDLKLPQNYSKVLLKSPDVDLNKLQINTNNSVEIKDYVDDAVYDNMLSTSVVFLNLFDAPANTTVIECISRSTPLVINRLPGLEEYLGKAYPLFYSSPEEAVEMITNDKLLLAGQDYLTELEIKIKLTKDHFISSIHKSAIYRNLPIPKSQIVDANSKFPARDVSVIICSYKRVYNLRSIFDAFVNQKTNAKIEIILWNNNHSTRDEIEVVVEEYKRLIDIKTIQSSENYFCIIRLAVVPLMRSSIMLICDDDVIPNDNFVSEYLNKYEQYGPNTVLCTRGHRFLEHTMDEENPETCWQNYDGLRFFDETKEDRMVHFFHADTVLIPKHLLHKILQYPLPTPETILVDDYWISFVVSHYLKVPIWKIKGDHIFKSTPCAEDENICLYKNRQVREEKINFYVYHMLRGWPNSAIENGL